MERVGLGLGLIQPCKEHTNRFQNRKGSHLWFHVIIAPFSFFRTPIFQILWNHEGEVQEIQHSPKKQEEQGLHGMAQQVHTNQKQCRQGPTHPPHGFEPNDLIRVLIGQKWFSHAVRGLQRSHHAVDSGHAAEDEDEVIDEAGNLPIDRERLAFSQNPHGYESMRMV